METVHREELQELPEIPRDQCLEALRFFTGKEIEPETLEQALLCCLENETPSFTNLKDSYAHFERENSRTEALSVIERDNAGPHQPLAVSRRQLSEYEAAARERTAS